MINLIGMILPCKDDPFVTLTWQRRHILPGKDDPSVPQLPPDRHTVPTEAASREAGEGAAGSNPDGVHVVPKERFTRINRV